MPIYEAECTICGKKFEYYAPQVTEDTNDCPSCGGPAARLFSRYKPNIFTPFVTRNIMPDGSPVRVDSQRQLSSLCNEHKLVHLDDPKWEPRHKTPPTPHEIFGSKDLPEARDGVDGGVCRQEDLPV